MKIRNGFVSNSSSSSFIVYGVKLHEDELDEKIFEMCEEGNVFFHYNENNQSYYFGEPIAEIPDDFDFEDVEINLFDLVEKWKKIKDIGFEHLEFLNDKEFKLHIFASRC